MENELITEERAKAYQLAYLRKFMGLSEDESRDLVAILTQPTPKELLGTRPIRGGRNVSYVPGSQFIKRFNEAFGLLWSFEVPSSFQVDSQIVVKGRWSLQIPGRTITKKYPDGTEETIRFDGFQIAKEQFGSSEVKKYASDGKGYKQGDVIDLGDDYKGAATDAMKKCGTQLGMFLDIYGAGAAAEQTGPSDVQKLAFYTRTEALGKSKEEADVWCTEQTGKPVDQVSQSEMLGMISDLISMAKSQ